MEYFFLMSPEGVVLGQVGMSYGPPDEDSRGVWVPAPGSAMKYDIALVDGEYEFTPKGAAALPTVDALEMIDIMANWPT